MNTASRDYTLVPGPHESLVGTKASLDLQPRLDIISTKVNLMLPSQEYDDPSINWIKLQVGASQTPSGPVYDVKSPTQMLQMPYGERSSVNSKSVLKKASKLNLNEEMKNISNQTDMMLKEVK